MIPFESSHNNVDANPTNTWDDNSDEQFRLRAPSSVTGTFDNPYGLQPAEQYNSLPLSDRKFLADVDAKVWNNTISGVYWGVFAGIVVAAASRKFARIPVRPFGYSPRHEELKAKSSLLRRFTPTITSYADSCVMGPLLSIIVTDFQGSSTFEEQFKAQPETTQRIQTALCAKDYTQAVYAYRIARVQNEGQLGLGTRIWYYFYYTMHYASQWDRH